MDPTAKIILLVVFLIAGTMCGMMFNYAMGRKLTESGGVVGGIVVGLLMWLI